MTKLDTLKIEKDLVEKLMVQINVYGRDLATALKIILEKLDDAIYTEETGKEIDYRARALKNL